MLLCWREPTSEWHKWTLIGLDWRNTANHHIRKGKKKSRFDICCVSSIISRPGMQWTPSLNLDADVQLCRSRKVFQRRDTKVLFLSITFDGDSKYAVFIFQWWPKSKLVYIILQNNCPNKCLEASWDDCQEERLASTSPQIAQKDETIQRKMDEQ